MINLDNFDMTLDECRRVFDTMQNLVIIDEKGYLKYLSPDMYFMVEAYNKRPVTNKVAGKHIDEIHPVSKITNVLYTGEPIANAFYFSSDVTNIARIEPLYNDGRLVGAIDYDIFTNGIDLKEFLSEVAGYEKEGRLNLKIAGEFIRKFADGKNRCGADDAAEKPHSWKREDDEDKEQIDNFDMTLDECRVVFDTIHKFIVTDAGGRIKYYSPDFLKKDGRNGDVDPDERVLGRDVNEVFPFSRINNVITSGRPVKNNFYFYGDNTSIARIDPVYDNGKVIGVIDYDIYSDVDELEIFLGSVMNYSNKGFLNLENTFESMYEQVRSGHGIKYSIDDFLGNGRFAVQLRKEISNLSETNSTVLITGETGCGKEIVAHSIHNMSRRCQMELVEVNCAAIPENLVESELFGYEEGSFTGASRGGKTGLFEQADGGTIFLDEIDQIPYHIQPKLLRILQEREITKIGGRNIPVDVRVISATNKNLWDLVRQGRFREDLYYRLNVVEVHVPALTERREDIPILVNAQIEKLNKQMAKYVKGLSPDVMNLFMSYKWPGNVRELNNLIERCMINCKGEMIRVEDLQGLSAQLIRDQTEVDFTSENPLELVRNEAEKKVIIKALEMTGGNRSKAAGMLKISRTALYDKLKKFEIL